MSRQNVEVVRLIYASLTRGDDGVMDLVGPDFVVDFSRRRVDPFVVTLDQEMFEAFRREVLEVWEAPPTWEPQELVDAGDKVFAFIRTRARGKASGAGVDAHVANVWTFRDVRPVELEYFGENRAEGPEAKAAKLLDSGDYVVADHLYRGVMKGSEDEIEWRVGMSLTFRNGEITDMSFFRTFDEALEAAGLQE